MNDLIDPELLDKILLYLQSRKAGNNYATISADKIGELAFGGHLDPLELKYHIDFLAEKELIKAISTKDGTIVNLLPQGDLFIKKGGFGELTRAEKEKVLKQEKLLELQINDLENRIATQKEQLDFWIETAKVNQRKAGLVIPSFSISLLSLLVAIFAILSSRGCM